MAKRKTGLGKGLDALIPTSNPQESGDEGIRKIPINQVLPNPHQPRYNFRENELTELSQSIQEHGILQPLIVTEDIANQQYTLIAGERRLQAAKLAGLTEVPVIIRDVSEQERLELALIENVQREDLNPLEKAKAYQQLSTEFNFTHEEIAKSVGVSRASVTNTLRLLNLPQEIQNALSQGEISEGHARTLLSLPTPQAQLAAYKTVQKNKLSVRQTEELVKKLLGVKPTQKQKRELPPELVEIERQLRSFLGTKVKITHSSKGGTIILHYYSDEELESLIDHILQKQ